MPQVHHPYGISERVWKRLEPHLPGREGLWGGKARDNRQFVTAVFWILQTGAPWRNLPSGHGDWKNTHRRFCRWRDKGIWEKLLEILVDDPECAWLLVDTGGADISPAVDETPGNSLGLSRMKKRPAAKYPWPWLRMVCRSEGISHKIPRRITAILAGKAGAPLCPSASDTAEEDPLPPR